MQSMVTWPITYFWYSTEPTALASAKRFMFGKESCGKKQLVFTKG